MATTTTYRYFFADLKTNAVLAELQLTGVSFTQQLNTTGTLTGRIQISGFNTANANLLNATIPARTAIYVDRNGVIVWGGIIWSRDYSSKTQTMTFNAREFMSYFERRRIIANLGYSNTDVIVMAQGIINNAQTNTYGNIGVLVGQAGQTTTGGAVTASRIYYGYELKQVSTAVIELSQLSPGFDWSLEAYYSPTTGQISKSFNCYYPRKGEVYSTTGLSPVFELPSGNIVEYQYTEDGLTTANSAYVTGSGSNEGKALVNASDSSKWNAGWALLEDSYQYSDVPDLPTLTKLATARINSSSTPPTTVRVIAPPYSDPVFGSYDIGDDVRLRITDNRFPTPLDAIYRLVALTVTAGEAGPEQITLTLTTGTT